MDEERARAVAALCLGSVSRDGMAIMWGTCGCGCRAWCCLARHARVCRVQSRRAGSEMRDDSIDAAPLAQGTRQHTSCEVKHARQQRHAAQPKAEHRQSPMEIEHLWPKTRCCEWLAAHVEFACCCDQSAVWNCLESCVESSGVQVPSRAVCLTELDGVAARTRDSLALKRVGDVMAERWLPVMDTVLSATRGAG
ncbi:hypothetical protein ERJ75_001770900 [Trypanosoma vivax]|nr:hypothetical protein ERJ75_001770900 [Trypanosoma vivax]